MFSNCFISGAPRSLREQISDLPMLLRHLWSMLWSGDGITMIFRVRIFLLTGIAIIYVLSPFDIIPEVVFGIFGLLTSHLLASHFLMSNFIKSLSLNRVLSHRMLLLLLLQINDFSPKCELGNQRMSNLICLDS